MKISGIKNLGIIAIAAVIIYIFIGSNGATTKLVPAFSKSVTWSKVDKIVLSKEGKTFELVKDKKNNAVSDNWVIPEKSAYMANSSTVQAFLLKLADISNAQKVQISDSGLDRLGLTEESKSKGQGVISLFDGEKEVLKIYIGSLRSVKGESMENQLSLSGQYVKALNDPQVYMIPLAVVLKLDSKDWINTEILKIEESKIYQIIAKHGEDDSSSDRVVIDRSDNIFSDNQAVFKTDVKIPGTKEVDSAVISQLSGSLANFVVDDVLEASSKNMEGAKKLGYLVFKLVSGLEYRLDLYKKDAKSFVAIKTTFSEDLASELKKRHEEFLAVKKEATPNEGDSKKAEPAKEESKLYLLDKEKASEIQQGFNNWLYEVSEQTLTQLNKKPTDFLKDKVSK